MKSFDLTPDPKVLIALTHTPLKPLDALSELIDNAIDAFTLARNAGKDIEHPLVLVNLPTNAELRDDKGALRIRDNGIGMSPEMAEKALKAGFTGNNPYDSLGLFGMGFNIATGKLARRTVFLTAREEDNYALKVVIDLLNIVESNSYEVIPEEIEKPSDFLHGTLIEVSDWWPEGNPNYGFIRKLVSYGRPRIRKELGRRYATILQKHKVRIVVDDEPCYPFEHCIWGEDRFVERRDHGKIYAVKHFSEAVGKQTRCAQCYALIPSGEKNCQVCESSSIRTITENIRGWVGIQRYDHTSHFGIDLIRNGRAIRLLEKAAFFEFTDEFGNSVKDYPSDSQYGRIVGEVHLDHVPVDFMKQDFQRSSPEWQRTMSFLRGDSSLQPKQPGADENKSSVFMLFQGYRRVRKFGRTHMYMGYWDEAKGPSRIDRETEKAYLAKFNERLPGYYDDAEWWKLVENADTKPVEKLIECPDCSAENLQSAELCQVCEKVLIGKPCIECNEEIAVSATTCQHCGKLQVPKVVEPWICQICGVKNIATAETCVDCDSVRGLPNPLSNKFLRENSDRDDDLSLIGCSVQLADGSHSQSIDVDCFCTHKPIISNKTGSQLPAVIHKGEKIEIFIDKQHPLFQFLGVKPEELIAGEVAYYIHVSNGRLVSTAYQAAHSLSNLEWSILKKYWADALSDNAESVREDVISLFQEITQRLSVIFQNEASDIFDDFSEMDKKMLVDNLLEHGEDISKIGDFKTSGRYLSYINPQTVILIFNKHTAGFFDGSIWGKSYSTIPDIPEPIMDEVRDQTKRIYLNCLEDCVSFLQTQKPDLILIKRTRSSLDFLQQKLEY
ncbi:ATP-binding protein [Thermodesulfobacteriota bacterium]